ncbi:hypothetical protein OF83DRAFT_1167861 [Amylostereum chailletii]|nr:hypothetical protein OF83DRAFT_1167861 [Amylostereum chailletii]
MAAPHQLPPSPSGTMDTVSSAPQSTPKTMALDYTSRLPVENIAEIFSLLCLGEHLDYINTPDRSKEAVTLSWVSRRWRFITLDFHLLWSRFVLGWSNDLVKTYIQRAGATLLSVYGRQRNQEGLLTLQNMEFVFTADVMPRIRLIHLDLEMGWHTRWVYHLLCSNPAPSLENFTFVCDRAEEIPVAMFGKTTPTQLRGLTLFNADLSPSSPLFSSTVTSLRITLTIVDSFMDALRALPALLDLTIIACNIPSDELGDKQDIAPVVLPCLRYLHVSQYAKSVAKFLRLLQFPCSAEISLKVQGTPSPAPMTAVCADAVHVTSALREHFSSADAASASFGMLTVQNGKKAGVMRELELILGADERAQMGIQRALLPPRVQITLTGGPKEAPVDVPCTLSTLLSSLPVCKTLRALTLGPAEELDQDPGWLAGLLEQASIERIEAARGGARALISMLILPAGFSGRCIVPFPRLQRLVLHDVEFEKPCATAFAEGMRQQRRPLRVAVSNGTSPDTMEALEEALGEGGLEVV